MGKTRQTTWRGYSGTATPPDARHSVGNITEGQAYRIYAMAGRATPEAGINKRLNVFLRGNLWDLGTHESTIVLNSKVSQSVDTSAVSHSQQMQAVEKEAVTGLWL